ncbi:MAG: cobaltochelatase subunit CobN [Methanimicrococcus sp.]|nr:cobaltochelatase subunit CobN [Methanimicrococcus sp.]
MKKVLPILIVLIMSVLLSSVCLADDGGENDKEPLRYVVFSGYSSQNNVLKELAEKYDEDGVNIEVTVFEIADMTSGTEQQQRITNAIMNADVISIYMVGAATFGHIQEPMGHAIGKNVYIFDDVSRGNLYASHPSGYLFAGTATTPFNATMMSYWTNATYASENMEYMISFVLLGLYGEDTLKEKFGIEGLEFLPVIRLPDMFIYHPKINVTDIRECFIVEYDDYMAWYESEKDIESEYQYRYDPSKPTVGIFFYRSYFPDSLDPIDKLIAEYEKRGVNALAITNDRYINNSTVDIVVNFQYLSNPPVLNYEEMGLPIINLVFADQTYENWLNTTNPLTMTPTKIIYPERYGSVDPIVVASTERNAAGRTVRIGIPEQIDLLVGRTVNYLDLQRMENADKDIALIYYNHGGGKGNIGASYLDVPASLIYVLEGLKNADDAFNIDLSKAPSSYELTQTMINQGINIGGWAPGELKKMIGDFDVSDGKNYYDTGKAVLVSEHLYMKWFREAYLGEWFENTLADLPEDEQIKRFDKQTELYEAKLKEVEDAWGTAPGKVMVYQGYIVIPYIDVTDDASKGRFILTPQPSRGTSENAQTLYHSATLPPTHQYIAFYLWLQNKDLVKSEEYGFGADAIIHFGTHGTQEWLPGQESGLSRYEWPAFLIGNLPVVYPYIVDVVGEGMQAKRRGNAVLVDHMTPAIVYADLYGDYDVLKNSIVSFESLHLIDEVKAEHKKTIIRLIISTGIGRELGVTAESLEKMTDDEFDDILEDVDEILEDLRLEYMPFGLHVFGQPLKGQSLTEMVLSMLGTGYVKYVTGIDGIVYEDAVGLIQDALSKGKSDSVIDDYFEAKSQKDAEYIIPAISSGEADKINSYLDTGLYYSGLLNLTTQEITQLVKALEGKFIFSKPGGDPVTNAPGPAGGERGVVPTGGNFYNFDNRKMPTEQAWNTAVPLTNQLLLSHYEKHGEWPRTIGFVLFAGESTRSEGVMESQILFVLGVKPIWNETALVTGFYPLKEEELRITVDRDLYYKEYNEKGEVVKSTLLAQKGDVLTRPRIDIVVEISSLYRDTYPDKVRLIDEAVRKVYYWHDNPYVRGTGETRESWTTAGPANYVYENTQELIKKTAYGEPKFDEFGNPDRNDPNQALLSRVFGTVFGTYNIGLSELIEADEHWNDTSDLAKHFINQMGFAYTSLGEWGTANNNYVFEYLLSNVAITVHSRSTPLYGVLDNDDFYQFLGGLNAAVAYASGKYPDSYIMNLRKGDGVMEPLSKFIENEIRARYTNQKWIDGMQQHGYAGAREFSKVVDYMWGWSALQPDLITADMWNSVYESFLTGDNGDWLKSDPQYSYSHQSALARMISVATKEDGKYWNPTTDVMNHLVVDFVESVLEHGVACCHHTCGNPTFVRFIEGQMAVAGINKEDQEKFMQIMETVMERSFERTESTPSITAATGFGQAIIADAPRFSESEREQEGGGGYGTDIGQAPGEVVGYEMTSSVLGETVNSIRNFNQNPTFSASSMFAIIFVVLIVGAIFYGFRRKD